MKVTIDKSININYLRQFNPTRIMHLTIPEQELITQLFNNGRTFTSIAKELSRDKATVKRFLSITVAPEHLNRDKNLSEKDKEAIVAAYLQGLSTKSIKDKLKWSLSIINKTLQKQKIERRKRDRKYPCKENYFHIIDSEEKAYWLGFLYADGNVSYKKPLMHLTVQEKDRYILDRLAKDLCTKQPVQSNKKNLQCGKYIAQPAYRLTIYSKLMKKDLIDKGCIPRKSLILTFPTEDQVPAELQRHFIRGYFDGDGCIHVNKTNTAGISILGTEQFCKGVQKSLRSHAIDMYICKHKSIYCIQTNKTNTVKDFCEFIYKDETVKLIRKYNKYIEWTHERLTGSRKLKV